MYATPHAEEQNPASDDPNTRRTNSILRLLDGIRSGSGRSHLHGPPSAPLRARNHTPCENPGFAGRAASPAIPPNPPTQPPQPRPTPPRKTCRRNFRVNQPSSWDPPPSLSVLEEMPPRSADGSCVLYVFARETRRGSIVTL